MLKCFFQANVAKDDADDTDKSDASTQKPDDFMRSTRKTPKRLPSAVVGKSQTAAVTETKSNDELTSLHTRSPAEPKDSLDSVAGDKKVASAKPKVTRQRTMEISTLPKSDVGKVKLGGNGSSLSKKTSTADDKTEKKPPGRPPAALKVEEKYVKKKLLLDKKPTTPGQIDVKRTLNLMMEKVDSNKEDKSSVQKRVSVYCCVFCD